MLVGNNSHRFHGVAQSLESLAAGVEETVCNKACYYPVASTATGALRGAVALPGVVYGVAAGVFGAIAIGGAFAANLVIQKNLFTERKIAEFQDMRDEGFDLALLNVIRMIRGLGFEIFPLVGNSLVLAADTWMDNTTLKRRLSMLEESYVGDLPVENAKLTDEVVKLQVTQTKTTQTLTQSKLSFDEALRQLREKDARIATLTQANAQLREHLLRLQEQTDLQDNRVAKGNGESSYESDIGD